MTSIIFDRLTNRATQGVETSRSQNIARNTAKSRPSTPRDRGKRPKRPDIRAKYGEIEALNPSRSR